MMSQFMTLQRKHLNDTSISLKPQILLSQPRSHSPPPDNLKNCDRWLPLGIDHPSLDFAWNLALNTPDYRHGVQGAYIVELSKDSRFQVYRLERWQGDIQRAVWNLVSRTRPASSSAISLASVDLEPSN